METGEPRILILKPSSLGDVVHTLPAVAEVRAHWPKSHISWLINPEWAPLLEGNSDVDQVIEFPRKTFRGVRGLLRIPRWLDSLGEARPDLALDFQGLLRTALIARKLRAKKIVGLSDSREGARFFHHEIVSLPKKPIHAVERYLRLTRHLGGAEKIPRVFRLPPGKSPAFALPEEFILLHPFSRGEGKSLPQNDVIELCEKLLPFPVVLVGTEKMERRLPNNVSNLLGKTTLLELIWLIRKAEFTVSVDSGPMHIASALTDRLLSIHTWSDPLLVGPYNREAWIWKNNAIWRVADYLPGSAAHEKKPDPQMLAAFIRSKIKRN